MILSIVAAVLHGVAYVIYLSQVHHGGSVPNPASWTVWAFLAGLNAFSFWKASKDPIATAQFFTGSVACLVVWIYSMIAGRFSALDSVGFGVLYASAVACVVWWATEAIYANIVVATIMLISSIPTVQGVWQDGGVERALPWYLWTLAFTITSVNVMHRADKGQSRWWLLMVTPVSCVALHAAVAVAAKW